MDMIPGGRSVGTSDALGQVRGCAKAVGRVGCPNGGGGIRGWGAVAFLAPAHGKFNIDTISRLPKDTQNLAAG